jgi:hypothetical protein
VGRRGCTPASSKAKRGRAAPGSSVDLLRRRGGGWRTRAAAGAGEARSGAACSCRVAGPGPRGTGRCSRLSRARVERRAEPERRLFAEGHDALLAALGAADVYELLVEVDVGEVEPHRFCAAQAGGVDELDERAVSQRDRTVSLERLEHALDLGSGGGVGKAARAARREPGVGDAVRPERMPEKGTHRGQLAADRGRRELPSASRATEPGDVVGEDADVDVVESRAALLEPGAELLHVAAVGATCALAQRRRGEKAVGGGTSVHSRRFPGYRPFPFR